MEFTQDELQLLQGLLLVEAADCLEMSEELEGIDRENLLKSLETARGLYKKFFNQDALDVINNINQMMED